MVTPAIPASDEFPREPLVLTWNYTGGAIELEIPIVYVELVVLEDDHNDLDDQNDLGDGDERGRPAGPGDTLRA